jgi:hypothetical protein
MSDEGTVGPQPAVEAVYIASLRPESRSLRDAFLRSFSQNFKIGKLFSSNGSVLFEGRTAVEWNQLFKVLPDTIRQTGLTPLEVMNLSMELARVYGTASSFHANLAIAAEKLEGIVKEAETQYIEEEDKKYKRGGEYWDEASGKLLEKRPARDALEKSAQGSVRELRKALRDLKSETSFFAHILVSLEFQRRILKDYSETIGREHFGSRAF